MQQTDQVSNPFSIGALLPGNTIRLFPSIARQIQRQHRMEAGTVTDVLCPFCQKGHLKVEGKVPSTDSPPGWGANAKKETECRLTCSEDGCKGKFFFIEE
ncbi:MAG: hypothetical protein WC845_00720 [Candidatus Staskawiczbacteria bacterium]|jgi:hypothetical protein